MKLGLALVAALLVGPAAVAAPTDEVMKPINQFIDSFNKGDTKTAFAAYAPGNVSIIDEFTPHIWIGPKAPQSWAADFDKHAAADGITDPIVKLGKPIRVEADGKTAYVVLPAVYTYKVKGKPMAEKAEMTYALAKAGGPWMITGWTWGGEDPHPVK
jgi:uncharacterized protein (DUF1800 family)